MENDNHLNIFNSYSQGDIDNIEDERVLEDNITRALIITLKENPYLAKSILEKIFGNKFNIPTNVDKDYFQYDLQNLSNEKNLKKLQKYSKKFILCISTIKEDKDKLKKVNLLKFEDKQLKAIFKWIDDIYKSQNKKEKDQLKEFRKNLISCIDKFKDTNCVDNSSEKQVLIKATEEIFWKFFKVDSFDWVDLQALKYLLEVSYGSRPDAWLWTDKFVILIENKINGGLYEEQIIRHITRNTGINSEINDIEIEIVTWEEILKYFNDELQKKLPDIDTRWENKNLIKHFTNYLNIKNIVMDLKFVIEEGFDKVKARNQFKLLLEKLDDIVKPLIPDIDRRKRPLADYIWDYYGIKRKIPKKKSKESKDFTQTEEIETDPHYSVYFDVDGAGISLTTKNSKLMERMLESEYLETFIADIFKNYPSLLSRYSLSLGGYGLYDFKKHAQRGETINTFSFSFNFSKLKTVNNNASQKESKWTVKKVLSDMKQYVKFSKQCELSITIRYPKKGKANNEDPEDFPQSKENAILFKEPDKLFEVYKDFIIKTKDLFTEINDEKTKILNHNIEKKIKKNKIVS